jgi:hypothetical protein
MAVFTIGAFSANYLADQPYGYEGEARAGRTARKWAFDAILTLAQTQSLISVYDTWRNARIQDVDTEVSGVVGTTVSLTCDSLVASVTNLPCWFITAPAIKELGQTYRQVTVELVDAAQALEVVLAEKRSSQEQSEPLLGDFGTYTLSPAPGYPDPVLTLTKPMQAYQDGPVLELMATGSHYLTGPLVATRLREIAGTTTATGWDAVRAWYERILTINPAIGSWFPTSPPSATAEAVIEGGVKITRYTVTVTLAEVR